MESDLFYEVLSNFNRIMSSGWKNDEIGRYMEGNCRGLISDTTPQVYGVAKENNVIANNGRDPPRLKPGNCRVQICRCANKRTVLVIRNFLDESPYER